MTRRIPTNPGSRYMGQDAKLERERLRSSALGPHDVGSSSTRMHLVTGMYRFSEAERVQIR
jgi:hypothetical protein